VRYGDLYTTHGYFIRESRSFVSLERAPDYTPIQYGDVLLAASGETLEEIGKSAVNLMQSLACCGADVIVFRPTANVDSLFLGYAMDCRGAAAQKATMGRGFTVVHIYAAQLKNLAIALPPRAEQTAIATFLDRETAKIDALVAEYRTLIELLKEKRQAVISHAVTKGLDPTVPMKDSGVEWLGEVPEHWAVGNVRYFALMKTGHTPSRSNAQYWEDCNIPWFTLADVWQLRDERQVYLEQTAGRISRLGLENSAAELLPARTVVFSRTASVGFSGIMPIPMATSQDFWNWVPKAGLVSEFLLYLFRAMKQEFARLTMGSTHKTIYQADAAGLHVCLPPENEQVAIVGYLEHHTRAMDALVTEAEQAISLLQERRTALISAAVTGKIDVRGLVEDPAT
jgi:type I restriction enzyme S subunit